VIPQRKYGPQIMLKEPVVRAALLKEVAKKVSVKKLVWGIGDV
jgi:hypothetical protein